MASYFNRASTLVGTREVAAQAGQDVSAAMQAVGLPMALFNKPDERIAFDDICALFEHCAASWQMPDFGLRLAPFQHLEVLGPVALVTKMERDLRSAMQAITRNLLIHSNALSATLDEQGDVASIGVEMQPSAAGTRQYMLLAIGVARNVLEQAGEQKVDLIEVSFRHDAGDVQAAAERYFGCPIRFGAERNAIYFDRATLDRPLEHSDAAYHAIIERYLLTARQEASGRFSDDVRHEIARQMELDVCTLDSVANSLRLEPRSLQRRLKHEGLSFRDLVDDWRKARAKALVTQTRLPLSEISLALGYSDQSIFSRAFQRWHGAGPLAYRRQALRDSAPA